MTAELGLECGSASSCHVTLPQMLGFNSTTHSVASGPVTAALVRKADSQALAPRLLNQTLGTWGQESIWVLRNFQVILKQVKIGEPQC